VSRPTFEEGNFSTGILLETNYSIIVTFSILKALSLNNKQGRSWATGRPDTAAIINKQCLKYSQDELKYKKLLSSSSSAKQPFFEPQPSLQDSARFLYSWKLHCPIFTSLDFATVMFLQANHNGGAV
jgi:hypothetical protein